MAEPYTDGDERPAADTATAAATTTSHEQIDAAVAATAAAFSGGLEQGERESLLLDPALIDFNESVIALIWTIIMALPSPWIYLPKPVERDISCQLFCY